MQFRATDDVEGNFNTCRRLIEECAEKGAQMVCLPEHFAYMADETLIGGKIDFAPALKGDLF